MPESKLFTDAEIIHAYSRAEALADGFLIDVSEAAKRAGFKWPTAVTSAVWAALVSCPQDNPLGQDEPGRLADLLHTASAAAIKHGSRGGDRIEFTAVHVPPESDDLDHGWARESLALHCGPGDTTEPVLTISLIDEC